MPNYDEIIKQSQANVESLSEKLKDLDKLYQDIISLKINSEKLPQEFQNAFEKIQLQATKYTEILGDTSKTYIDGNNTMFTKKLNEFSDKNAELDKEISRLNDEISRLKNIDLEKHFDKLQKTLSDIFGAINAINLTLSGITSSLTSIIQGLGQIQKVSDDNFKELNNHLNQQGKKNEIEFEILKKEVATIKEKNSELKKEIKTNRVIQIVGLFMIILTLIYLIIKH
jgi:hypothetical protein